MQDGHGGITVGSEMTGGVRNVFAEHDTMNSPNLQYGMRFKTNTSRGGFIENIYARNIYINQVSTDAIYATSTYSISGEYPSVGTYIPVMDNFYIDSMKCNKASNALSMDGLPSSHISNVVLTNSIFTNITNQTNHASYVDGLSYVNVSINGNILTSADEKSGQNELPGQFLLRQNYPNPFNPSTKINYQLPEASHVTLRIYDIMGREVAVLVDGNKGAGYYTAVFDGARLASGVYFTRLIVQPQDSKQFVKVKKMLLIK